MSYVNAGPVSVTDGDPLDTPNGSVTSAGFNDFSLPYTTSFDTDWMLGWNYFPNDYSVPANAMVRFRLQPGSGLLNVIMATREAGGDFVDRNSGSIAYTLGDDIDLQVTRNAGGLISLVSGATTIVSATPPHPIAVNEGYIHWGNTTPGSAMVLTNINYVEAAPANSDPVLDTPHADVSITENAVGSIDFGANFSDADLDTLSFSISPDISLLTGWSFNTTTGVASHDGTQAVASSVNYTITADDGNGGTPATDVVAIEVTAVSAETIALIVASLPAWSNFLPGTHTISVEWDGGTVTFDHEFTLPAGWSMVQANGAGSGSDTSLAKHFLDTYGITVTASDYYAFTAEVTVGADGEPDTATDFTARLWDDSAGQWTTAYSYVAYVDETAPTVQILNAPASVSDTSAFNVTVEFSEDVTGFVVGDISVTNATLSNFAAVDGNTYTVDVTPDEGGNIAINVGAAVAQDAAANDNTAASQVTVTYVVVDVTAPVITLLGSSNITIAHGSTYNDAGATAVDDTDGDITGNISVTGSVDTNTLGAQVLSYDVSDAAGNVATTVTRTVTVTDQAIPSIALNGTQTVTHEAGDTYTDAGATASDAVDGDLTGSISVSGSVDSATPGSYTLNYDVSDAAGNAAVTVTRTVTVVDTTAPVITLTGPATINRSVGEVYTELGATWIDAVDGTGDATVGGDTVDTSTEGTYTVTYDISDNAGNAATQVTRSVNVSALIVPTVTTQPAAQEVTEGEDATFTVAFNNAVSIQWFDASDDSPLAGETGTSLVVTTVLADDGNSYYAVATSADGETAQSNTAVLTVNAVVVVGPTVAPTINTGGSTSITLTVGDTYSDPNWSASDDLGAVDVDWPAGTIDTSSAGTFTRTASATNAVDTVTADYTVTVVEPVVDYVDPREILKVAKSNDLVFLHDGSEIPETAPKSPNSIAYKGFQILGLSENEVIQQYWVLIEGQIVEPGESVNGLRYESALTNNVDRVKVLLSGGTSGLSYRLTLRFKTQHVPLDERSQDFEVKPL